MNGRQRRTHLRRSGRASASEWRRPPHTPPDRAYACPHASLGATTTRPARAGSSAAAVRCSAERTAYRKPASRLGDGLHPVRVIGAGSRTERVGLPLDHAECVTTAHAVRNEAHECPPPCRGHRPKGASERAAQHWRPRLPSTRRRPTGDDALGPEAATRDAVFATAWRPHLRREVCTDSLRASVCWRRCDMAIPAERERQASAGRRRSLELRSPRRWTARRSWRSWARRRRGSRQITQNGRRRITLRARMLRPCSGKPIRARCS